MVLVLLAGFLYRGLKMFNVTDNLYPQSVKMSTASLKMGRMNARIDKLWGISYLCGIIIFNTCTKSTSTPIFAATKSNQTQYEF
jgi:hypothetical protein